MAVSPQAIERDRKTRRAWALIEKMQEHSRLQFEAARQLSAELQALAADEYEIDHVNLFADKARGDGNAAAIHASIVLREVETGKKALDLFGSGEPFTVMLN